MVREIRNYKDNCGPIAIKCLTDRLDGEILDVCLANGFNNGGRSKKGGMYTTSACKALEMLSMKCTPVSTEKDSPKQPIWSNEKQLDYKHTWNGIRPTKYNRWRINDMTVNQFIAKYPTGNYLLVVEHHFIAIKDGKVFDNAYRNHKGGSRMKCKVRSAHQVEPKGI